MFVTEEELAPPWLGILARVLVVGWCVLVSASFVLTNAGIDGVDTAAEFYAPLSTIPMVLIGALAVRTYGMGTRFGRAAMCVVVGAVAWDLGDLYYSLSDDVPYASLADAGYLLALVVWSGACVQLWRAVGIGRRDVVAYWWVPACSLALVAVIASPTFAHVGSLPLGFDIAEITRHGGIGSLFATTYFVADAILVAAAIILWRRSYGFHPYRLAVRASVTLFVADVVYEARVAMGAYDAQADVADAFYALSIAFLMFALLAFERAGRAERTQRAAALAYARERFGHPIASSTTAGSGA